jgi:hypothetical protein
MQKEERENRRKSDEMPLQQPLPPFLFPRNTPVTVNIGGGYARNVSGTVDIHFQTVKIATQVAREFSQCHPFEKKNYLPSSCQAERGWQKRYCAV